MTEMCTVHNGMHLPLLVRHPAYAKQPFNGILLKRTENVRPTVTQVRRVSRVIYYEFDQDFIIPCLSSSSVRTADR